MIWLLLVVVVGAAVVFGPAWTEAEEHITLADLLEQVSSKQYLERSVSVFTAKDEHAPVHAGTLSQPLLTFYTVWGSICQVCGCTRSTTTKGSWLKCVYHYDGESKTNTPTLSS